MSSQVVPQTQSLVQHQQLEPDLLLHHLHPHIASPATASSQQQQHLLHHAHQAHVHHQAPFLGSTPSIGTTMRVADSPSLSASSTYAHFQPPLRDSHHHHHHYATEEDDQPLHHELVAPGGPLSLYGDVANRVSLPRPKSKKEKRSPDSLAGNKPLQPSQHIKKLGEVKIKALLLIDDEKVKPIEVDLHCKTYPKEQEAFTSVFLRQNEFARRIFVAGDRSHFLQFQDHQHASISASSPSVSFSGMAASGVKLLKWYFQEDHLTFPRLCLIYQNRCSSGRNNPWVPKLIQSGPTLRGPVLVVQQKKSPNAETVVFDQYLREDRHMLPAAASFLPAPSGSPTEVSPRGAGPIGASRSTRAAPPLALKGSARQEEGLHSQQQQHHHHPYLSLSSSGLPTHPHMAAVPTSHSFSPPSSSPPSSRSSSKASSPASTPPSSVPHSPRNSISGAAMLYASAPAVPTTRSHMAAGASSSNSSFSSIPVTYSDDGSLADLSASSFYGATPISTPHLDSAQGLDSHSILERPAGPGNIPVSRSVDDFSAFSSGFPSLWSSFPSSTAMQSPATPLHATRPAISSDNVTKHSAGRPLSLTTSGIFVPSNRQYKPLNAETIAALARSRAPARHFSWEGPIEIPAPSATEEPQTSLRPSVNSKVKNGLSREEVDEQIIAQLKKTRDGFVGSPKAKIDLLVSTYEEYLKTHGDKAKETTDTRRTAKASDTAESSAVTHRTKLHCRTLIFGAKIARLSDKCDEACRDKASLMKWEQVMRNEVQAMLTDGLIDKYLVDKILLACFSQRRASLAHNLVREIRQQMPTALSREEWILLADTYELFSPWLAACIRKLGTDAGTAHSPIGDERQDVRATLRIIRRRSESNESRESDEEELYSTVAPFSATISELKQKLWLEQSKLAAESGDESDLLRPAELGILYKWSGGEVQLEDDDVLQDFLLPTDSMGSSGNGQTPRSGAVDPHELIIINQPRLFAFAHFSDFDESLVRLRAMLDAEERSKIGPIPGSGRAQLYDYLCNHFEYLEQQDRSVVRNEHRIRKQVKQHAERHKKDLTSGYHESQSNGRNHKEKQIEPLFSDDNEEGQRSSKQHSSRFTQRPIMRFTFMGSTRGSANTMNSIARDRSRGRKREGERLERCAIHLGSLTKDDEEPIYAVFAKNPSWPFGGQRWLFVDWSDYITLVERHGLGSCVAKSVASSSPTPASRPTLPMAVRYFSRSEDLYMMPDVRLYLNADHLLQNKVNQTTFDRHAFTKDELNVITDNTRRATLEYALSQCNRALQADPSLAVPQMRIDGYGVSHFEFLVPLYIKQQKTQKPDLVLVLERRYDGDGCLICYVATRLLSPLQAYTNARRIKKVRQNWLLSSGRRIEGMLVGSTLGCNLSLPNGGQKGKARRNNNDKEEEEFRFEHEIEKWASETDGESENNDDDPNNDSPTLSESGNR